MSIEGSLAPVLGLNRLARYALQLSWRSGRSLLTLPTSGKTYPQPSRTPISSWPLTQACQARICLHAPTCLACIAIQLPSVPGHISIRDISFHASTEGVRIIAVTDIPCHLYCRLTSEEPWIHKKPSLRRGVQFAEDVRFCFTVFEDNDQNEWGDTLEHTWWKPDWPVCTTKWFYFWGYVAGKVAVSSSAFFKYHNDGVSPVPPWVLIFHEPWPPVLAPPFDFEQLYLEPWDEEGLRLDLIFLEPWTS